MASLCQREALDKRIVVLEAQLCSLKEQRNAFAQIYRRPPEVLVQIFQYLQYTHRSLPRLDIC
jgi:hypothetical protein